MADLSALRPFLTQLLRLAKQDRDPELYAEVLLDQLRDHPPVMLYLSGCETPEQRAELETQLAAAFPDTAAYPGWFRSLWAAVWAALDAEDEVPQTTGGPTSEVT